MAAAGVTVMEYSLDSDDSSGYAMTYEGFGADPNDQAPRIADECVRKHFETVQAVYDLNTQSITPGPS
jgi:hypothetical protein